MAHSFISKFLRILGTVAVAGDSMAPTYLSGDWLIVRWGSRCRVGGVVVIERTEYPGIFLVKRLLRIEGEKYWVEGDNKNVSTDSRQWGAIGKEEIIGSVLFRFRRARTQSARRYLP